MNKKIFIGFFIILITFVSCKNKKAIADGTATQQETQNIEFEKTVVENQETIAENHEIDFVPEPRFYDDNVIIALEKTICFGTCPVFKLQVYKDYTVEFEGIANTNPIGWYKGKTNEETVTQLFILAEKINYFGLKNIYSKPITDVPVVYSSLLKDGKRKSIINHFMGPDELTEFENFIEMLFKPLATEEVGDKK